MPPMDDDGGPMTIIITANFSPSHSLSLRGARVPASPIGADAQGKGAEVRGGRGRGERGMRWTGEFVVFSSLVPWERTPLLLSWCQAILDDAWCMRTKASAYR
eukprot:scaffold160829_cov24-Tisochrysis_lutea.AAC.1